MVHPEFTKIPAAERFDQLRRDAHVVRPARGRHVTDTGGVELRLRRTEDDPALELLAALEARPLPRGRMVLAVVRGGIVAAQPLDGGTALRDPFVATEHLLPLLELRATQLRGAAPVRRGLVPRRLVPRYVSLMRGSIHA